MIRRFLRPNLIKKINIRTKCDFNCKEKCIDLMSKQTESLYRSSNYTQKILVISIINLMSPVIKLGLLVLVSL